MLTHRRSPDEHAHPARKKCPPDRRRNPADGGGVARDLFVDSPSVQLPSEMLLLRSDFTLGNGC